MLRDDCKLNKSYLILSRPKRANRGFRPLLGNLRCLFLVPIWGVDCRKDSVPNADGTRILPLLGIASLTSLSLLESHWKYHPSFLSWETPYEQTQHRGGRWEESKKSSQSNDRGRQRHYYHDAVIPSWSTALASCAGLVSSLSGSLLCALVILRSVPVSCGS